MFYFTANLIDENQNGLLSLYFLVFMYLFYKKYVLVLSFFKGSDFYKYIECLYVCVYTCYVYIECKSMCILSFVK